MRELSIPNQRQPRTRERTYADGKLDHTGSRPQQGLLSTIGRREVTHEVERLHRVRHPLFTGTTSLPNRSAIERNEKGRVAPRTKPNLSTHPIRQREYIKRRKLEPDKVASTLCYSSTSKRGRLEMIYRKKWGHSERKRDKVARVTVSSTASGTLAHDEKACLRPISC